MLHFRYSPLRLVHTNNIEKEWTRQDFRVERKTDSDKMVKWKRRLEVKRGGRKKKEGENRGGQVKQNCYGKKGAGV